MFASTEAPAWLDGLNDSQRRAVLHDDGPLLVVAGAGSGKTRTLASRVARLLDGGAAPDRVLLLTFTRRAAAEMLARAERLADAAGANRVWGGTFHAVANRLLRRYGARVGLRPGFTVLDQGDSADLLGLVRAELGLGEGSRRFPQKATLAAIYSRTVNAQKNLSVVLKASFPWCAQDRDDIRAIFTAYTERKRRHNVVDFDDLLLYWRALALADDAMGRLFDHVLVDEYQDTNAIQADILAALGGAAITAVGDDAQAIYSFRAARVENIEEFPDRFPGTIVVTLEQNYRSTPQILAAANAVMAAAPRRYPKDLWSDRPGGRRPVLAVCADEPDQSARVCDRVLAHREEGVALRDQAVLFRTGHHSDALELELARRNIPFVKFGGLKFLEGAHVKDLLALLRILDNPADELAWHRVLRLLDGVGPATARKVVAAIDGPDPLGRFLDGEPALPAAAAEGAAELRAALTDCRGDGSSPPPAAQIERLRPFCALGIERRYDSPQARLADLDRLRDLAGAHSSRGRFLADVTLDPPSGTGDFAQAPHLDDDYLVVSTIHSAKGGEWRAVHVLHAADGNIPSDMALGEPGGVDEERRLLYVALTRAKDALYVYFPLRYHHRRYGLDDAHHYAQMSRFLVPAADYFDHERPAAAGADEPGDEAVAADPVAAVLGALWEG